MLRNLELAALLRQGKIYFLLTYRRTVYTVLPEYEKAILVPVRSCRSLKRASEKWKRKEKKAVHLYRKR